MCMRAGCAVVDSVGGCFTLVMACVGLSLGVRLGSGYAAAGALAGVALGPLCARAFLGACELAERLAERRRPPRPLCFAGHCGPDAYELVAVPPDARAVWRCACGDEYVERDERFLRRVGGEVELTYMVKDERGRWVAEAKRVA